MSSDYGNQRLNEADFSVTHSTVIGGSQIDSDLLYYYYPGQDNIPPTFEHDIMAGYRIPSFSVYTSHAVDLMEYSGSYFGEIGGAYETTIAPLASIMATTRFDWGSKYFVDAYVGEHTGRFIVWQCKLEHQIDQHRKTEMALAASEGRYRIVSEQTGPIVYDWDIGSGKIVWAGAVEAIADYTLEEFTRFSIAEWEEMIHPEDRKSALYSLDQASRETR